MLYLKEEEVRELIDMPTAISAVENVFRQLADQQAQNIPRQRVKMPGVMLHSLSASASGSGYLGWKNYTTTREQARFHVGLYNAQGDWVCLMEADWLGQLRTGAASGVATKHLALPEANSVGIFGAGKQAATQLEAICSVRPIQTASVYSRSEQKRCEFAETMSKQLEIEVIPVSTPEEATCDQQIIATATTSREPVLGGRDLSTSTHLNAIGSNALNRSELDLECFQRIDRIFCDDLNACKLEAGDFVEPLQQQLIHWEQIREIAQLVSKPDLSRQHKDEITLFKSVGMAVEDVAVGAIVYERALKAQMGREIEL